MSQLIPYEELKRLGNIPIDMGVLKSIYEHYQAPNMRIAMLEKNGVPNDYFPIGITMKEADGVTFLIATPEKALCDMLMVEKHVPDQSLSSLAVFFEEDMRIDLDDLRQLDPAIIKACAAVGKKRKVLENLLKLIAR